MNKLYSKESSFGVRSSKDGRLHEMRRFGVIDPDHVKNADSAENKENQDKKKFHWGKPVKF